MKNKYNFKINPKRLREDEISKHMDFDALLKRYHHDKPIRKPLMSRMVFIGLALAASVSLILFFILGVGQDSYLEKSHAHFASQEFINRPFPNIESKFASYQVNANEGGIYTHHNGSKINVPPSAFVSSDNAPIDGDVTIYYREMHDYIDFFMSGIPMTYDSAGVQYTLESAGMIEIFAEKDGKRVNMAPGKSIDVELVSNVNMSPSLNVPPGYNIYQLDEKNRKWVYKEIDRIETLDELFNVSALPNENSPINQLVKSKMDKLQAIQVSLDNEIARIDATLQKPKQPVKPNLANQNEYVFDIDFNDLQKQNATGEEAEAQKELSELYRQYEKMLWQLGPNSGITAEELQAGFSNVSDISIKKLNNRDYELMLKKDESTLKVVVNPVLSGSDYQDALADFNRDFENWQKAMNERNASLQAAKNKAIKQFEEEQRLANLEYDARIEELQSKGLDHAATNEIIKRKVINRFQATGFGVWNCDRPLPPDLRILAANFETEKGEKIEGKTAYLVDKNRNTVYQLLAEDGARLRFNKGSENLLWLVTKENKIAVFRPEDFRAISDELKEYTFVFETIDKTIDDENDVREVLYL